MFSGMCMALLSVFVIFLLVKDAVYKVSFTLLGNNKHISCFRCHQFDPFILGSDFFFFRWHLYPILYASFTAFLYVLNIKSLSASGGVKDSKVSKEAYDPLKQKAFQHEVLSAIYNLE
jgi:hypothetical protein